MLGNAKQCYYKKLLMLNYERQLVDSYTINFEMTWAMESFLAHK